MRFDKTELDFTQITSLIKHRVEAI